MASFINNFITLDVLRKANADIFKHSLVGIAANECTAANPYLLYRWENIDPATYLVTKSFVNQNGHLVSFLLGNVRNYVKLHVPGNILTYREKKNYWNIYTDSTPYISLEDRTNNYSNTLDVFVNRKRVNKTHSYVTVMDGSIDLYVPRSYFNVDSTDNKVWIYVNQYETDDTFREYQVSLTEEDVTNGHIDIPIDNSIKFKNPENFFVYINGLEQTYITDYVLVFNDDEGNIRLRFTTTILANDLITIKYEKDVRWMTLITNPDGLVYIPNSEKDFITDPTYDAWYSTTEIPLVDWPICEHICDVVVNGYKVETSELKEVAPRLIQVPDELLSSDGSSNNIQIRLRYPENLQTMHPHKRFVNDKHYFLKYRNHNKWSTAREAYLSEEISSWIDQIPYPPEVEPIYGKYDISDTSIDLEQYLGNKIIDRIENDHGDNIKSVLEQFEPYDVHNYVYGDELDNYIREDTSQEGMGTLPTKFSDPRVVFTTMVDHRLQDYEVLVFVDGLKIPKDDVHSIKVHNRISAYIDSTLVNESSVVTLWVVPVYHRDCELLDIAIKENGSWNADSYSFSKTELEDLFGLIRQVPDDIRPLLRVNDNNYQAISSDNYNVEIVENTTNNTLELVFSFDDNLGEDGNSIVLTNASFTYYFKGTFGDDGREIFLYTVKKDEDGNKVGILPRLNTYTILVFVNGKYMVENEDYIRFESDGENDLYNFSLYLLKRLYDSDTYEIYLLENYYEEVFTKDTVNNPYGIITLDDIRVPYDEDYLDLYINNKLIDRHYIEFITSKVIRVHSQPVPFSDIRIYSKLSIGLKNVQAFVESFEETEDEYYEYVKKKEEDEELDEWYEGFIDDPEPNPEKDPDEEDDEEYEPIKEEILRDWKKEGESTDNNDDPYYIPRRVDCNLMNITELLSERAQRYKTIIDILYPEELYPDGLTLKFDCNETIDDEDEETFLINGELYSTYDPSNVEHLTNVFNDHRDEDSTLSDQILNDELTNKEYYSHFIGMYAHPEEYKYIGKCLGY